MSLEITQAFVRPTLETPWFVDTLPESHWDYFRTNYINTGKIQVTKEEISDGMILYVTFSFPDFDAQLEFVNDKYFEGIVAKRDLYNQENRIEQIS